ncbi:MAG: glucuronate isomerase [Bacteroidota bacterium]|jgi:glucuronate isomerase
MKAFLDDNFLLSTATAQKLYHQFAASMPIIDYHCHLSPQDICEDRIFNNLTEAWLYGDHYKWRAMRTNGVDESYCTGQRTDFEKFEKWAETVPYTLRNPLYHWTHLELQRYFGVKELLNPASAKRIYDHCSALLNTPEYSVRNLLRKMNVQLVCTTDDPLDNLEYHVRMRKEKADIQMIPAFRPDKAMEISNPVSFRAYISQLSIVSGIEINHFNAYLQALKRRHDYFHENGCRLSDHGLEEVYAEVYDEKMVADIFEKVLKGDSISVNEIRIFKSAMLLHFAEWDHEKGWVQQFHLGALRNNNSRMMHQLGADTGWDSIGVFDHGRSLSRFLDKLDTSNKLTKTILYNLNPSDNEVMATMIGNFNDGSVAGRIQFGSAWWFLDQKDGMIRQINALSNMGLLSRFVGMLTDSRSFLSFPRHEYFRRILCDMLGKEVEDGELPADMELLGKMVQDICYQNNVDYFGWKLEE